MEFERYEMRFKLTASKSPMSTLMNERWMAKVEIEGAEGVNYDPSHLLIGMGENALQASQGALAQLAQRTTYQEIVLETAIMAGTRTAQTKASPLLPEEVPTDESIDPA